MTLQQVLPVGGMNPGTTGPYLAAGAAGFGIGSSLYQHGRPIAELSRGARALVEAYRAARVA